MLNRLNNYFFYLFFIYFFTIKIVFLNLNSFDFFYKLNVNDGVLFFYYFFWTNFWFLFIFFFVIFLCYCFKLFFSFFKIFLYLILTLIVIYCYELFDYILGSLWISSLNFDLHDINLLLLNNLNKIHPYLFYLSLLITFCACFYFYYVNNCLFLQFLNNYFFLLINDLIWSIFYYNFLALFLGSWWALQEGTWGGWWNWDASETFGLLFLLNALFFMHTKLSINSFTKVWFKFVINIYFLTVFYYLIQLNFDLISHNFGIKFFYFFNNNLFFLEILALALVFFYFFIFYFFYFFKKFIRLFKKIIFLNFLTIKFWYLLIIYFFINVFLFISFAPLITYFFWTFFGYNLLNLEFNFFYFSTFLFFYFFIFFNSFKKFSCYLLMLLFFVFNYTLIFNVTTVFLFKFFHLIHFLVISLLHVNLIGSNLNLFFFDVKPTFFSLFYDNNLWYKTKILIGCDSLFIEFDNFYNNFTYWNSNWFVFFIWKNINLFNFNLIDNFSYFINIINFNSLFLNIYAVVEIIFTNFLLFFFLLLLASTTFYLKKSYFIFF